MAIAKVREILQMLRRDGWYLDRQTGSHRQLCHPTKPHTVTVNGHEGDTIEPVSSIQKQGLTKEDLR
jgi:predicted RNA binding protein YcfA (HicA-like mRNA interferase family)